MNPNVKLCVSVYWNDNKIAVYIYRLPQFEQTWPVFKGYAVILFCYISQPIIESFETFWSYLSVQVDD